MYTALWLIIGFSGAFAIYYSAEWMLILQKHSKGFPCLTPKGIMFAVPFSFLGPLAWVCAIVYFLCGIGMKFKVFIRIENFFKTEFWNKPLCFPRKDV